MRYLRPGTAILVTGATGGIGFEVARHAAEDGAIVGVHGSRQETVDATIARILASLPDAQLVGVPANFHEEGAAAAMVDGFTAKAGRIDALVHCGITGAPGTQGLFRNTDPAAYGRNAELVLATFQRMAFAAYQHMMKQDEGGTIVAYVSDAGRYPAAHQTMLGSVFGAIIHFVRTLGYEGARDNVRAHAISPSYVKETPVFERFGVGGRGETAEKRAGLGLPTPRDLAPLTLFLCGPDATKMTGQVLSVNGGLNT